MQRKYTGNLPSVKTLTERLLCSVEQAKQVRQVLSQTNQSNNNYNCNTPYEQLYACCEVLGGVSAGYFGVEYIAHKDDGMHNVYGLDYINTGDTYTATLIFDHTTGTYKVCSWGDIVERYPNRAYHKRHPVTDLN